MKKTSKDLYKKGYLKVYDISQIWKVTTRRVNQWIKEGRIVGAKREGDLWFIPKDATKPADKRRRLIEPSNDSPTIIDLCSGAGGFALGFVQGGYRVLDSVEIDKSAVETFNRNFKRNDEPKDITDETVREEFNKYSGQVDCVIAGLPCQGFSMAGKRDPNDLRNKLYLYAIDIINRTRPKMFVVENVKGLLSMEGGEVIKRIQAEFSKISYYTNYAIANSVKFGVPQKRERLFIFGSSEKEKVEYCIDRMKETNCSAVTVEKAIGDLQDVPERYIPNHTFNKHSEEYLQRIKNLPVGECLSSRIADAYKRIHYDRPSPTVKENHGGVFIHPKVDRFLTPRELARLQTFPDDFIFPGAKSQALKQIGNAVPVKMAKEIAMIIKNIL